MYTLTHILLSWQFYMVSYAYKTFMAILSRKVSQTSEYISEFNPLKLPPTPHFNNLIFLTKIPQLRL